MTSTTGNEGRLGNQIIRNLAVSLLAEKHNLKVNYYNKHLINKLGIELFSGSNSYKNIIDLTDDNYFDIYNSDNLNNDLNPNKNHFQTKKITNLLYNYLNEDKIKSNIIERNPFKHRYNKNNDLLVHIRLTDAEKFNPGFKYYINAIKKINFDTLYISTDHKNNYMVRNLLKIYPKSEIIDFEEIHTFQFASTCKHIILSHGSFSATIGYLSFFSDVYYHEYMPDKIWHGDMFSIDNWIKLGPSQYITSYPFAGKVDRSQLVFAAGEVIYANDDQSGDWWWGSKVGPGGTNVEGWFPPIYVKKIIPDFESARIKR